MARYQVILVYDGTHFRGFQRQVRLQDGVDERTVQGEVQTALRRLGWQGQSILGAGRTDAGVHAAGQVIAFDLDWKHGTGDLQAALNSNLPEDIGVRSVKPAPPDFHPRYDAIERVYHYHLFCQSWRDPLRERYAWRVWPPVDMARLELGTAFLPGTHDFSAFGTPPRSEGHPVRSVTRAAWSVKGDDLVFEIAANAFLYHMVRRLVHFLVAIGQGKFEPEDLRHKLEAGNQPMVQGLAPAHGLSLVEVLYPDKRADE